MAELMSGFGGPSGPGAYLECPLEKCGWLLRQDVPDKTDLRAGAAAGPPASASLSDVVSTAVGAALVSRARREEAAVRAHLDEHDVLDFLTTIQALRQQITELESAGVEVRAERS